MEGSLNFYKLDKSKKHAVEGTQFNVPEAVFIAIVLIFFIAIAVVAIILNFNKLFANASLACFVIGYILTVAVVCTVCFFKYRPVFGRIMQARKILKNCTLTDGTVTEIIERKAWRNSEAISKSYTYYDVCVRYSFYGIDGNLRQGELHRKYVNIPFFKGQNLMVAFNGSDSVILNKFSLSDGAEIFALAEEEREKIVYSNLTGNCINVDVKKPVELADYPSSKTAKRKKRLTEILQNPSFAAGRYFIKKSTYKKNAGNLQFYCFIDKYGFKHVEECAGVRNLIDGSEIIVAYRGDESEIISHCELMKNKKS